MVVLGTLVDLKLPLSLPDLHPIGDVWVAGDGRLGFDYLIWSVFELLKAKEHTDIESLLLDWVGAEMKLFYCAIDIYYCTNFVVCCLLWVMVLGVGLVIGA